MHSTELKFSIYKVATVGGDEHHITSAISFPSGIVIPLSKKLKILPGKYFKIEVT